MIPIIFNSSTFTRSLITDSTALANTINGLGVGEVSEAESAVVSEERNAGFTLNMTVPETAKYIDQLNVGKLLCVDASPRQKRQMFEIVKVTKNLRGLFSIYAEHVTYRLMYSVFKPLPLNADNERAIAGLNNVVAALNDNTSATYYVSGHPFTFVQTHFPGAASKWYNTEYASVRSLLFGKEGSILDVYGGCYKWDNWTVTLDYTRGSDNGVKILYGKNLTDITAEYNNSTQATANGVYGYYKNGDTIIGASGISTTSNTSLYPYGRYITRDMTSEFDSETTPTAAQIKSKTDSFVSKNLRGVPDVNLKTSFILLGDTLEYKDRVNLESVEIDDTVHVYVPTLDVDVSAKVIKTNYNVLLDRYDSVEVGNFKTTLNQAIRAVRGG